MLCFLIDIIIDNLLLNCFVYFKKIVKSENVFQSFFYFLILIRSFLIILSKNYLFNLIRDIYQSLI